MEKYIKIIRKNFPDLHFTRVNDSSDGIDYVVLILDGKYVFRFPKKDHYKKVIQTEMKLLDTLQGLPVPHYLWKGKDFGGYQIIKGNPLTLRRYKLIKNKEKLHREIASFLTKLHSKKTFPGLKKQKLAQSITLLDSRMKIIKKYLTKEQILFTKKYLKIAKKIIFPSYCITHADLHYSHILVDKEFKGVIDFSDAEIGDPAIDFHSFWLYGKQAVEDIYQKYKGPKDPSFLYRSQLYHYTDYLSALYHSHASNKLSWRKGVLRRIKKIIDKELKLS